MRVSELTAGDGNGWVDCACGHKHWGRYGAAGLLLASHGQVLLQLRSGWTHNGGTWALPGGARDSHETPVQAALREASEETSLDVGAVIVDDEFVDTHGDWTYTTVIAHSDDVLDVTSTNQESDAMQWWPIDEVETLPLHYGFAATWPLLRERLSKRLS